MKIASKRWVAKQFHTLLASRNDRIIANVKKSWFKPGVWNMEQFDPDPFMELLNKHGLPTKTIQLENKVNF